MTIGNPVLNQSLGLITVKTWKGVKTSGDTAAALTNVGDVAFIHNPVTNEGRFLYRDNDCIKASELLSKDIIHHAISKWRENPTAADGTTNLTKMGKKIITIDINPDMLTSNNVKNSEDVASVYLQIRNWFVIGLDNRSIKHGYAQLHTGKSRKEVILSIAKSLTDSIKREQNWGIKIHVGTVSAAGVITQQVSYEQLAKKKYATLKADYIDAGSPAITNTSKVVIEEVPCEWELGKYAYERPDFSVTQQTVNANDLSDQRFFTIEDKQYLNTGIANGRLYAELEYWTMGWKGNQTRKNFFPYNNYTPGIVDPTKEYEAVVIDSYFQGPAEDVQRSPKTLYVIAEKPQSGTGIVETLTNDVLVALGLKAAPAQSGSGS